MPGFVQIVPADGDAEVHPLDGERVTIGTAPSATISLPHVDSLEGEHLLLVPGASGCWVSVSRGARTTPRVDGDPLEDGEVPWGTEITVGALQIRLSSKRPTQASKTRPLLLVAVLAAAALVVIGSSGGGGAAAEEDPVSPSPLFDAVSECDAAGGSSLHRARESLHAARAGEERYPFASQDGVEAVHLYRRASACFAADGLTQQAVEMRTRGQRLEARIEEDYRTLRLALSRQLSSGRTAEALRTTRSLRELLRHRNDPYAQWLGALERRLVLALDQLVEAE